MIVEQPKVPSLAGLPAPTSKRLLQSTASAREPGHHRAYRRADHACDLLVRHLLDLTQHDDLASLRREFVESETELGAVRVLSDTDIGGERGAARVGLAVYVVD